MEHDTSVICLYR